MVGFGTRRSVVSGLALGALLLWSGSSLAAAAPSCEESFRAIGDPRNGLAFQAGVTVPGLTVSSALGQLRQAGVDEKFTVGGDVMEGQMGQLLLMQESSNPPVVVMAGAAPNGMVVLSTKLARGQKMELEAGKQYMCGMLAKLKPGKEGEAIAAEARRNSDFGKVTDTTAVDLSTAASKDVEKVKRSMSTFSFKDMLVGSHTSPDELKDRKNAGLPLAVKYLGRKYRIDGQVYTASINQYSGFGEVGYLVTKTRGLLRVRQDDDFNNGAFTIVCQVSKDQNSMVSMLGSHDWVKLEGTVDSIDFSGIHLKDCRQAN